jgi:deoxyadenosine/deoxycytidine kinase
MKKLIAIEGNIGVGKTTLARFLSTQFDAKLLLEEFLENKFLKLFYESKEFAFQTEMQFLLDRSLQLNEFFKNQTSLTFTDFHIDKSLIFSKINLGHDDYKIIKNTHLNLFNSFPKPDCLIFLDSGIDQIIDNIKSRNRANEKQLDKFYLEKLNENYDKWINAQEFKIIRIPAEDINYNSIEVLKNKFAQMLKINI